MSPAEPGLGETVKQDDRQAAVGPCRRDIEVHAVRQEAERWASPGIMRILGSFRGRFTLGSPQATSGEASKCSSRSAGSSYTATATSRCQLPSRHIGGRWFGSPLGTRPRYHRRIAEHHHLRGRRESYRGRGHDIGIRLGAFRIIGRGLTLDELIGSAESKQITKLLFRRRARDHKPQSVPMHPG